MKILTSIIAVWFACFGIQTASAAFFVDFYLSAPGVQTSFEQGNAGTATEDFNSLSVGAKSGPSSLSVGNYTGSFQIYAGDQWGGATVSNYVEDPNAFDITFTTAARYVGFWWSAGNAGNTVQLYSGGALAAEFKSSYLSSCLNNGAATVTPLYGMTYNAKSCYGNPNQSSLGGHSGEPFGYINLFARNRAGFFDRVVFKNVGFEFDNVTASSSTQDPRGSSFGIGSVNSASPTTFSTSYFVPESSQWPPRCFFSLASVSMSS